MLSAAIGHGATGEGVAPYGLQDPARTDPEEGIHTDSARSVLVGNIALFESLWNGSRVNEQLGSLVTNLAANIVTGNDALLSGVEAEALYLADRAADGI